MRLFIRFSIILCMVTLSTYAQKFPPISVSIADAAPPIHAHNWIKGMPVNSIEKGKIYVVEFWATWCRPCRAVMPKLSALARKYSGSVTVLGVDIYDTMLPLGKIEHFVDSMGTRMDYNVAVADSNYMVNDWLNATGQIIMGIPTAFIIDREGRLAWMGHPCDNFEDALSKIVGNTWDINKALAKRNLDIRLRSLDDSLIEILKYAPNGDYRTNGWKRDSGLLLIDRLARTEPLVKFTPNIAYQIFSILVNTNTIKAYEYGEKVIATTTYEEPAATNIKWAILNLAEKINLPPLIYQLGIDALQVEINQDESCFPEILHAHRLYYQMAKWYWHLGKKSNAVGSLEKGIKTLRSEIDFNEKDLAMFNSLLKQYRNG